MVLDREQGGKQLLQEKRLSRSYAFSISEVVEILKEVDHLTEEEVLKLMNLSQEIKLNSKKKKDFLTNKN